MFLKSIKINSNIVLDSTRESQKQFFKVKEETYTVDNHRKPIYENGNSWGRQLGYEKEQRTERTFVIHKKGFELNFNDELTIIVGDNGSGKSHLLNYIEPKFLNHSFLKEEHKINATKSWISNEKYTLNFCGQPEAIVHGNQIHKGALIDRFSKINSDMSGFMPPNELIRMWDMQSSSNGENVIDFIKSLNILKNCLIVLDEPETSLSIKSQGILKNTIKNLLQNENQLIIITHNSILMELSEKIYDFERKCYVSSKTYINKQLNSLSH